MIHSRCQDKQQVVQHHRLVIQIELDRLVVQFNVGHFCDDVFEVRLAPGLCGVGHHGQGGVVILFIFVVKEDQFGPQMGLFGGTKNLQDEIKKGSNLFLNHTR